MATAAKNTSTSTPTSNPHIRLLRASVIGAVYVGAAIAFVAFGIPTLWRTGMTPWLEPMLGSFFNAAGLIIVLVTAAAGLLIGGLAIAGPNPPDGLRAGVFTILAGVLAIFLATVAAGQLLERYLFKTANGQMIGLALTLAVGIGLLYLAVRYMLKPAFGQFLITFEHQGWFRTKTYKVNQGQKVRRLTILGILILVFTGIWTLWSHNTLVGNWTIHLPFARTEFGPRFVTLLPDIAFTVPLLLAIAGIWVAWRAANFPVFADFLIATEAEMNKVSWTNRRRLVQDTIVVLITVFMFAVFLLVVDQAWGWLLTRETLFGGIVPKPRAAQVKPDDAQEIPW
jgi:preprotein translocase SecE subunit